MKKVPVGEFRAEINRQSSQVIISGDILFINDISYINEKVYIVKLHNNSREFRDEDPDRAILLAMSEFLEIEI